MILARSPEPLHLSHVSSPMGAVERRALEIQARHGTRHRSGSPSARRSSSPRRSTGGPLSWHILGLHRPEDHGSLEGVLSIYSIKPVPRPASPKAAVSAPSPSHRRRSSSPSRADSPSRRSETEHTTAEKTEPVEAVHKAKAKVKPKVKAKKKPGKADSKEDAKTEIDEAAMAKVMECFRRFDVDGNGMIERWEFKEVLQRLDDKGAFTDEAIEMLFVAADADKDDRVNFEEMLRWIFCGDKHSTEFRSFAMPYSWEERLKRLAAHLASSAVQVHGPAALEAVDARLSAEEVEKVFVDNVPGVKEFLFRGQSGKYSLSFVKTAYADGLQAFHGTELHNHFMWLLRLVVHNGYDGAPGAAKHLRDVAEAFQDCQAVQARVIERAGLQIQGLSHDFRGLLAELAGEYKMMALKELSYKGCVKLGGPDETKDPAHYENLVLMNVGEEIGFSAADVKRAQLDKHAASRFSKPGKEEQRQWVADFRGLVDVGAMLKGLRSELNSFSETSPPESLPRTFLSWASDAMTQKHVLLDEETYVNVDVEDGLALAILEVVFFGSVACARDEEYRGERLRDLFFAAEY